ncbi:hypothetical protein ACTXT7_012849 [Hymenolepis weldensis]
MFSGSVEFTTLTRLVESRTLEQAGKCGYVPGCVENKRGVCTEASSAYQQSRSLQTSVVLYLMTKLVTTTDTEHNKVSNESSPLNLFLVFTTLDIA